MPSNGYVMMQMSSWCMPWCECLLGSMLMMRMPPCRYAWCKCPIGVCHDANVPLWVRHDANASCRDAIMQTQYIQKFPCFQNEASSAPEIKIFSRLDLSFPKGSSIFLKVPKNWWSLSEIPKWGVDLKSDDLAQKIYFHNWGVQKGWHISKAFFWKNEFFENQTS